MLLRFQARLCLLLYRVLYRRTVYRAVLRRLPPLSTRRFLSPALFPRHLPYLRRGFRAAYNFLTVVRVLGGNSRRSDGVSLYFVYLPRRIRGSFLMLRLFARLLRLWFRLSVLFSVRIYRLLSVCGRLPLTACLRRLFRLPVRLILKKNFIKMILLLMYMIKKISNH